MGYNDQGSAGNLVLYRPQQLVVQVAKMMLGGLQQLCCMRLDISCLKVEFRELKSKSLQRTSDVADGRQIADDIEGLVTDDERLKAVVDRVVLDQHFFRPKHCLHFAHFGYLEALQRRPA